jgi:glucokinase-like ROK family protein
MKKATRQDTREHNRNLVLKTIFDRTSISRAEIARVTSLTRTTVSDIVAGLLEEELVSEIGVGSSLGGKNPVLLGIVEDSRYLIGLDLARNQFRGAIVNLRGKIRETVTLSVNSKNGDEALALVYKILDRLVEAACLPMVGIGIGAPGLVNISEGTVINSVNLDWVDLPLARLMEERYHLPVYVLNDSQAAAMGEYTYGKNHSSDSNLVVINARHGIGAGIIINGRLFQGDGGSAGEIGHVVVVPEGGKICRCGNRGCLETVASTQALIKTVQSLVAQSTPTQLPKSPQKITLEAIELAFSNGDPLATRAVLETGRYMGMAISSLVGTLNIQKILLTGDMTRFGKPWLDAIRAVLSKTTLSRMAQETQIETGQLGGNDIILGASAMLASNYSLLFKSQLGRG